MDDMQKQPEENFKKHKPKVLGNTWEYLIYWPLNASNKIWIKHKRLTQKAHRCHGLHSNNSLASFQLETFLSTDARTDKIKVVVASLAYNTHQMAPVTSAHHLFHLSLHLSAWTSYFACFSAL